MEGEFDCPSIYITPYLYYLYITTTEYQGMAKIADDHRLAEQRCIGLYNALIDDTDNKKGLSTESP